MICNQLNQYCEYKENGFENCIKYETGQLTLDFVVNLDICWVYLLSITRIVEDSQSLHILAPNTMKNATREYKEDRDRG